MNEILNTKENTSIYGSGSKKGKWTKEEDVILQESVERYGRKNWKIIAEIVKGRTSVQCLHRWSKILKPGIIKGPWTTEQDRKLLEWVRTEGPKHWNQCAEYITGRTGKQCRERWFNTLNPQIKKGEWTPEEDFIIFETYRAFGSQWTKIAKKLNNGRTENAIKNRFYSTLRRIAAKKKNESWELNCNLPFNKIIEFLPDAVQEKTMNYISFLNDQQFSKELIASRNLQYASENFLFNPDLQIGNNLNSSNQVNQQVISRLNQTKAYIQEQSNDTTNTNCQQQKLNLKHEMINIPSNFQSHLPLINSNYQNTQKNTLKEKPIKSDVLDQVKEQESRSNALYFLDGNFPNMFGSKECNYFVANNQLNNFIEKLINQNYKVENCSGKSYYIDVENKNHLNGHVIINGNNYLQM